ncbi:MAG TPA: helix-turn-helix transcriptional regulator [Armatimonadota bacterium]|nr:helix-turn-helix transcriptional regulator [Armatimonadota bacterium]
MIQNERQYEITRKKLQELAQALHQARANPAPNLPLEIQHAGRSGIEMLMEDLETEIAEYEQLKSGRTETLPLASVLDDLPTALVQARVARGWSHRDLARALGTTEQQVQKDESGGYARASLKRLHRVADALALTVTGEAKLAEPAGTFRPERRGS